LAINPPRGLAVVGVWSENDQRGRAKVAAEAKRSGRNAAARSDLRRAAIEGCRSPIAG
jgi:hypothetical protein